MPVRGVLRRIERAMSAEETARFLEQATVMRIGTVDKEGWPYVVPLSFVYHNGKVYFHHTAEDSHLTSCLEADSRVCIEVDEAGSILSGGDTGCDASQAFTSVVAFGRASLVTDPRAKQEILRHLLAKYADPGSGIPTTYQKLEATLVFQIDIDTMTGKRRELS